MNPQGTSLIAGISFACVALASLIMEKYGIDLSNNEHTAMEHTHKVFPDKIVYYKNGKPTHAFKIKDQKKELSELMEEEMSRFGQPDYFEKTQHDYHG